MSGNHLESWGETRKNETKRRKEDESIYEVTRSADKTEPEHDDVYEVIKTNDTEYIDNEDDRVVIEHDTEWGYKNFLKNQSLAEENVWRHSVRIFRNKYYLTRVRPEKRKKSWIENNVNNSDSNFRDPEIKEKKTSFLKWPSVWTESCGTHLSSVADTKSELTIYKEVVKTKINVKYVQCSLGWIMKHQGGYCILHMYMYCDQQGG